METPEQLPVSYFNTLEEYLRGKLYYGWQGAKQFDGTGERLSRAFEEFCWPSARIEEEVEKALVADFFFEIDEQLVEGPIDVYTLCPHHLLPCHFVVFIGYIPTDKVLGLSKFARAAVALGKRPVMQEMYTKELADALEKYLKPRGVGVFVIGEHGCMQARGIKQNANVTTAVLKGALKYGLERSEFYSMVREKNCK